MNRCSKLAAAVALTLPAFGQLMVDPERASELQLIFDTAPAVSTLRCEISPMSAALNYAFQFQVVYQVQIPLTEFGEPGHTLTTYTRVTPEGRPPVYLAKANERVPETRAPRTYTDGVGAFVVGEGTYRADVLVQDDTDRTCRATWQVKAHRAGSETQLQTATRPGTVEELTLNGTPQLVAKIGPRIARLTVLVNAAPLAPRATELQPDDIQRTVDSVTSLLREMPAQTSRVIAFNLDQRAIIFRNDEFDAAHTGELADALRQLDFSVVDAKALRDRMQPLDLLTSLMEAELGGPQLPDAVIVIGPRTLVIAPLPADAMSQAPNAAIPVFSLQFQTNPQPVPFQGLAADMDASQSRAPRAPQGPMIRRGTSDASDIVERLVARIKGQTIPVRTPHDLADAIQRMDSRIARTAAPAAPAVPAPPTVLPPVTKPGRLAEAPQTTETTSEITGDEDPVEVLIRLRDRVSAHGERIPNHTCVETIQRDRYESTAGRASASCGALLDFRKTRDFFQRLTLDSTDWLRLDVAYSAGREIYSWAGAHKFEESDVDELVPEGAIGTGPFTGMVLSAFESRDPKYVFDGETKVEGRRLFAYSFAVPKDHSHYRFKAHRDWVITGYSGNLLVDPKTAELVRLTVRTDELPAETGTCEADTTLEYSMVQLSGGDYLLPKVAHQRFIGRDGFEGENTMSFSECRDFRAESKVDFEAEAADGKPENRTAAPLEIPPSLPVTVELTTGVLFGEAAAGDVIEGRLAKPILDEKKQTLVAEGAAVRGRLMRVEVQHSQRKERTVVLRWETIRAGTTWTPLVLRPNRSTGGQTGNRRPAAGDGLRRRGVQIVLPLPSESRYAVFRLPGTSAALESGTLSEWVTDRP
jgi:hypothetical protein